MFSFGLRNSTHYKLLLGLTPKFMLLFTLDIGHVDNVYKQWNIRPVLPVIIKPGLYLLMRLIHFDWLQMQLSGYTGMSWSVHSTVRLLIFADLTHKPMRLYEQCMYGFYDEGEVATRFKHREGRTHGVYKWRSYTDPEAHNWLVLWAAGINNACLATALPRTCPVTA